MKEQAEKKSNGLVGKMIDEQAVFSVQHLKKSFGGLSVLRDISMQVRSGEIVSIIGPSGSGKSTLLRCVTGLEQPDSGEISFQGSFGMVFQQFNLFPHWSVLKNVTDALIHVQKKPKEAAQQAGRELLSRIGLSDKADSYPYQLSGGQQQRVAIARALALNPEILFFDEPTSALDPELTQEVLKVIKSLKELKIAMVIVTHEMAFARDVSDRIIFMADGVIVEEGAPETVLQSENPRLRAFLSKF